MNYEDVPEFRDWNMGAKGFSLFGFIAANVPIANAFALAELIWPAFVEYKGYTFLKFKFDKDGVDSWLLRLDGESSSVESVVNHVHLWDLFTLTPGVEYELVAALGELMSKSWLAAARTVFPGRDFTVTYVSNDAESGEYGPTLSLSSIPPIGSSVGDSRA